MFSGFSSKFKTCNEDTFLGVSENFKKLVNYVTQQISRITINHLHTLSTVGLGGVALVKSDWGPTDVDSFEFDGGM